jgi:hypothetical protein
MVVEGFMFYMSSNTRLNLTPGQKSQLQEREPHGHRACWLGFSKREAERFYPGKGNPSSPMALDIKG